MHQSQTGICSLLKVRCDVNRNYRNTVVCCCEHSTSCWLLTAWLVSGSAAMHTKAEASRHRHDISDEDQRGGGLGNDEAVMHFHKVVMRHQKAALPNWKWGVSYIASGKQSLPSRWLTFTQMGLFEWDRRGHVEMTSTVTKMKRKSHSYTQTQSKRWEESVYRKCDLSSPCSFRKENVAPPRQWWD